MDGEAAEAAGVDEADLAGVSEGEDGVGVRPAAGHAGCETRRRPVIPRWTRNSAGEVSVTAVRSSREFKVMTMVLPTRRTLGDDGAGEDPLGSRSRGS